MKLTREEHHERVKILGVQLEKCINSYITHNARGLLPEHITSALATVSGEFLSHMDPDEFDIFVKIVREISSTPSPRVKILKMSDTPQ